MKNASSKICVVNKRDLCVVNTLVTQNTQRLV